VAAHSKLNSKDCLFILSVGGGNVEKNVSPNLVAALQLAKQVGARIIGIVGKDGGYTAKVADACVIVPTVNPTTSPRTARPSRRSSGTCSSPTPTSRSTRPNGSR
jgi:DNA-binding MurR/RpiR family transcriptional regulator